MDDQQALAIVSALANGANPITGEIFAATSPYQAPDVIRALFLAQRALEARLHTATRKQDPAASARPPSRNESNINAGKPWSGEEDKQLLAAFDANKPINEIARTHSRTAGGVRARLEKHGRLEPSGNTSAGNRRWNSEPKAATAQAPADHTDSKRRDDSDHRATHT